MLSEGFSFCKRDWNVLEVCWFWDQNFLKMHSLWLCWHFLGQFFCRVGGGFSFLLPTAPPRGDESYQYVMKTHPHHQPIKFMSKLKMKVFRIMLILEGLYVWHHFMQTALYEHKILSNRIFHHLHRALFYLKNSNTSGSNRFSFTVVQYITHFTILWIPFWKTWQTI